MGGNGSGRHKNEQKYIQVYDQDQFTKVILGFIVFSLSLILLFYSIFSLSAIAAVPWFIVSVLTFELFMESSVNLHKHKIPVID